MRALRLTVLTAAAALACTGTANGVVAGTPDFTLAAFMKPQPVVGGAPGLTMEWVPVTFVVPTGDEHRGAAATNDRNVALALTADDPLLIDGRPGTSSGVTQFAVDVDGDGTFPCEPLAPGGDPPDRSGCAQDLAATATATLPPGDGIKTLGVSFGDGARAPSLPCAAPCAVAPGGPILGNASGRSWAGCGCATAPATPPTRRRSR